MLVGVLVVFGVVVVEVVEHFFTRHGTALAGL